MAGGPGIGTVIGGLFGGLSGMINAGTTVYAARDDAFKEYYNGLFDTVTQATEDAITSGSVTAGSRETTLMSFTQLLGGRDNAGAYLDQVKTMANATPFTYDDLTGLSKTLLTYGYAQENMLSTLTSVGDTAAALGMDSSNRNMVATALGRMNSTDKASLEYINLLTERGVGAIDWLAERDSITVAEVYDKISKGEYSGKETSQFILSKMDELYGGMMAEQAKTFEGLTSTLEGWQAEQASAAGEGYNDMRKQGIQAEIDAYGGLLGTVMEDINRLAGENKAYLENLSEQYQREALGAVLLGEKTTLFGEDQQQDLRDMRAEFIQASAEYELTGSRDAALKMQALEEQAEALGTAAYDSSDQVQTLQDVQMDQISAIRENTEALEGWKNDYYLSQEQSKGQAAAQLSRMKDAGQPEGWYDDGGNWHSFAVGLDRVPYDNFPALLHEGEQVLTAEEARSRRGNGGVSITIGSLTVREDADVDRIAQALVEKIALAEMAG